MRLVLSHSRRLAGCCVLALVGATAACGYAVVRPRPPFGASRVAVVPFLEDEPAGIAPDLAVELAERLAAAGVALTTDRAAADAVLTGRVLHVATRNAPVASRGGAIRMYRVSVTVLATLERGGSELWRTQLDVSDDFLPAMGPPGAAYDPAHDLGTEANRREALRRLGRNAAQAIADALFVASSTARERSTPPAGAAAAPLAAPAAGQPEG